MQFTIRLSTLRLSWKKSLLIKKSVHIYFKYSIRSLSKHKIHCAKNVCIRSFLSVFSRIRARKVPNMDTFHTMKYGNFGVFFGPNFSCTSSDLPWKFQQTDQKKVREFAYFTCWQYSDTSILFLFTLVLFETKSCINLYLQKFLTRNFIFKCCEKNFWVRYFW